MKHTKYRQSEISNRQLDTFIGLAQGVLADGVITQQEAEFLEAWMIANSAVIQNPRLEGLWRRITEMLEDGLLDEDEQQELFSALQEWTGGAPERGELHKSASFPVDDPLPKVAFSGKRFLFTGTCTTGSRATCNAMVEDHGGIAEKNVTKRLDYLVIGYYASDEWIHQSYGRKIEKADRYREQWGRPAIITEEYWRTFLPE